MPGRYNIAWFEATRAGRYRIFCAEYCGTSHSDMLSEVVVHNPGEFDMWLEEAANVLDELPPAEAGEWLFDRRGCKQCHTMDGTTRIGPSFLGSFGTERYFKDGTNRMIDENYIRESIVDPQANIAAGFEPVMPTYQGRLSDEEITYIIEFIKSLRTEQ